TDDAEASAQEEHRRGRAHAAVLRIDLSHAVDHVAGVLDRSADDLTQLTRTLGVVVLGDVRDDAFVAFQPLPDEFHRFLARDLSFGAATHTVRDHEHAELRIRQMRVLVVFPGQTHVGVAEITDLHPTSRYHGHRGGAFRPDRAGISPR